MSTAGGSAGWEKQTDKPVVEVHDGLDGRASSSVDVSFKSWHQRSDHVHSVSFPFPYRHREREIGSVKEVKLLPSSSVCVLPVSFDDPLGNGISDLVENVSVVGTADEELILDVDVVLAVSDDFNVGVVDGLFMVLDASGPV